MQPTSASPPPPGRPEFQRYGRGDGGELGERSAQEQGKQEQDARSGQDRPEKQEQGTQSGQGRPEEQEQGTQSGQGRPEEQDEAYGPLDIERHVKDDGRLLIIYARREHRGG
jgi:hypothetical protein